jgi:uncharacterized FAD-dependent dehydrogenase
MSDRPTDTSQLVTIDELVVPLKAWMDGPRRSVDHHLHADIAQLLKIAPEDVLNYTIDRRSLDARRKPDLLFRYRLQAQVAAEAIPSEQAGATVLTEQHDQNDPLFHLQLSDTRPRSAIVVGTGPAGIMAAYLLALHGTKVHVIDRGYPVEQRAQDLEDFHQSRAMNGDSNYLYGEGGAGTYSDGKLYTRAKDRRMRFILDAWVAARAPADIRYVHHPHIGSDILPHMARRLRYQIEAWGGSFTWGANVTDVIVENGRCQGVRLANGERFTADTTLIACGHSARDLILTLCDRGVDFSLKGYQLGCRIEHSQNIITHGRYGCEPPHYILPAAEYNLVSRPPPKTQTVSTTTFCMCPGGEILVASSDEGHLCTNGMSKRGRRSGFANAGLICNQPVDRNGSPHDAFATIARLEQAGFAAGGNDWSAPAQSAHAFMRGENQKKLGPSTYRFGLQPWRLDQLLPSGTVAGLRAALKHFDRQLPGFIKQGQLIGTETRVSSPVRFERDPATLMSSVPGLYLSGEGAGYAGGIISAALDGIRLAETMLTGIPAKREKNIK